MEKKFDTARQHTCSTTTPSLSLPPRLPPVLVLRHVLWRGWRAVPGGRLQSRHGTGGQGERLGIHAGVNDAEGGGDGLAGLPGEGPRDGGGPENACGRGERGRVRERKKAVSGVRKASRLTTKGRVALLCATSPPLSCLSQTRSPILIPIALSLLTDSQSRTSWTPMVWVRRACVVQERGRRG